MSDNYKVIREARENIKDLKAAGWSHGKIAKEIDVAHGKIQDILEIDEVALDLREPTIEKLRKFNKKVQNTKDVRDKMEKKDPPDPEPQPLPPPEPGSEYTHEVDAEFVMTREHRGGEIRSYTITGDMMELLTQVTQIFQERGYRMDLHITQIYKPEKNERE